MKSINLILVFFCLLFISACNGSKTENIEVKTTPEGFEIFDTDTLLLKDNVFVINALRYIKEDSLTDLNPELIRPLIVLKLQPDNKYGLISRNDSIILCHLCGGTFGDPWEGIEILDNGFMINHFGGSSQRWGRKVSFTYRSTSDSWILESDISFSVDSFDPENSYTEKDLIETYPQHPVYLKDYNIYNF